MNIKGRGLGAPLPSVALGDPFVWEGRQGRVVGWLIFFYTISCILRKPGRSRGDKFAYYRPIITWKQSRTSSRAAKPRYV